MRQDDAPVAIPIGPMQVSADILLFEWRHVSLGAGSKKSRNGNYEDT